ncbi:MAG: hypothetical protein HY721_25625 [Planctomycetes bacterium]|nr:hypothetical protein [Planctomycetota bacterium]
MSRASCFVSQAAWVIVASVAVIAAGCSGGGGGGGSSGSVLEGNVEVQGGSIRGDSAPLLALQAPAARPRSVSGATVEALDADGDVVATATTDASGHYSLELPDGCFTIGVASGTMDGFTPLGAPVIVGDDEIQGADDSSGTETLDLTAPAAAQSVSGTVTSGGTGVSGVGVEFVDRESDAVRYEATTDSSGSFTVSLLPAGAFVVRLDPDTVPHGFAAPSPQDLSVTQDAVTPSSLAFVLEEATVVPGVIETTSGASRAVAFASSGKRIRPRIARAAFSPPAGAVIVVIEEGLGEVDRITVQPDGTFSLNLRDGTFILEFLNFGTGVVALVDGVATVFGDAGAITGFDIILV